MVKVKNSYLSSPGEKLLRAEAGQRLAKPPQPSTPNSHRGRWESSSWGGWRVPRGGMGTWRDSLNQSKRELMDAS